jgi:hypothetical protein
VARKQIPARLRPA